MFSEESTVDQITVTENNTILIRTVKKVFKDGVLLTQTYHRDALQPGADLTNQDPKVVSIANSIWN